MSQENVELVRTAVAALGRRDFDVLSTLCHEDFQFESVFSAVDAGGATYGGKHAWEDYVKQMDETWEDWRVADLRVFDAEGDRVAAVFRLEVQGKHSGVHVDREVGIAYGIKEGKLWRARSYPDPAEALEAVGLAE